MNYRTLGRTGIKVSPYCLGAMMFGGIANSDHDESLSHDEGLSELSSYLRGNSAQPAESHRSPPWRSWFPASSGC